MPTPEQNLGVNMTGAKMSGRAKMSGLVCWRLDDYAMDKHQEPVKRCEQNEPQQTWQNQFPRDLPALRLLEHGAGHVIVSLRHPVSRIVSGMQWHTHVYNMTLAIGAFLNSSSSKLSIAGATGAHNEQSERSDRGQFSHGAYDLQHKATPKCAVSGPHKGAN